VSKSSQVRSAYFWLDSSLRREELCAKDAVALRAVGAEVRRVLFSPKDCFPA